MLVDCSDTENFINLNYAKWLGVPIKQLPQPRKLFNMDGTENKGGQIQFYTDISIQTGQQWTNHQFFLSDLGDQKAILGYPWFTAAQPKIDWAWGWIDSTQLPIIFRTEDFTKAQFMPWTQNVPKDRNNASQTYCTIWWVEDIPQGINPFNVTPENLAKIPKHYHKYLKVFSEAKA